MYINDEYIEDEVLIKKLKKEIKELHSVYYNNGSYYDVDGLFFDIREKQTALRSVEARLAESAMD